MKIDRLGGSVIASASASSEGKKFYSAAYLFTLPVQQPDTTMATTARLAHAGSFHRANPASHSRRSTRDRDIATRAADADASTTENARGATADDSGASRRRTPLERVANDPLTAFVMAPRVALGGATEALDLLQSGELFGVAARFPAELNTLMQDPRPPQDKAAELLRRAEEITEMLEERGIVAEAPGRELLKPMVPAELFDRYLDPEVVRASTSSPTETETETAAAAGTTATTYAAEPPTAETLTDTAAPPAKDDAAGGDANVDSIEDAYAFMRDQRKVGDVEDEDDPAVLAAAADVAAALKREAGAGKMPNENVASEEVGEAAVPPPTPSPPPPPPTPTTTAPFDVPQELDVWGIVKSAEELTADIVMSQSKATATATKR